MPDNGGYYHAAYIIASALYVGYVASLWWRSKRPR